MQRQQRSLCTRDDRARSLYGHCSTYSGKHAEMSLDFIQQQDLVWITRQRRSVWLQKQRRSVSTTKRDDRRNSFSLDPLVTIVLRQSNTHYPRG